MAKSRNQRRKEAARRKAEQMADAIVYAPEETEIASSSFTPPAPFTAHTDQQLINDQIIGALGRMAAAVEGLANQVSQGFSAIEQRILTIEEAQATGIATLSDQSGLALQGLQSNASKQDLMNEQKVLVSSREFRSIQSVEQEILREEGFDLPSPNDPNVVLVGATSEAEVMRRREMIQNEINNNWGRGY